jgi:pSer/pThr/pTyr-binding forkhead associated (FHA) protein
VISNPEMSFGRDPLLANQIIDDPSLDGLHARLIHQADGTFHLFDVGSVSGTWVNYTPVTQEGICLEHGDLIHFGRMSFPFQVREPKQVRKPVARPKEPAL